VADIWTVLPTAITGAASIAAYFLGGLNERRRDERVSARERAAREDDRAASAERSRNEFQLATLLELQESTRRLAQSTARTIIFDERTMKEQGQFTPRPGGFDEGGDENHIRFIQLSSRVLDDDLRKALEEFNAAAMEMQMPPLGQMSKGQALKIMSSRFDSFSKKAGPIVELIGEKVRELLNLDVSVPSA